jgi:ubiquitin-like-conjugating enzyme ATG3
MADDAPKLSVKEKLFDFMVSASNAVSKTSNVSTFATTGKLTPEEFVAAGDLLVYKCGSWSWSGGDPRHRVDYLPQDKQLLITRHVTCNPVKLDAGAKDMIVEDDWLSVTPGEDETDEVTEAQSGSASYGVDDDDDVMDDDDDIADADTFDEDVLAETVADMALAGEIRKTRTYDVTICYNKYFQVPHVWLFGYSKTGQPLKPVQMYEDISEDHRGQTVTVKPHPHLNVPYASIHPCRHADVMQKIVKNMKRVNKEPRVDQYMFIFLKFMSAVIPNIEYDNTFDLDISLYPNE